jgi:hypothetical protein
VVDTGAVTVCKSLDELITETRKDMEDRGRLAPQRKHLVETICGRVDGHAGERQVDAILQTLGVARAH